MSGRFSESSATRKTLISHWSTRSRHSPDRPDLTPGQKGHQSRSKRSSKQVIRVTSKQVKDNRSRSKIFIAGQRSSKQIEGHQSRSKRSSKQIEGHQSRSKRSSKQIEEVIKADKGGHQSRSQRSSKQVKEVVKAGQRGHQSR